jgi:hypothetical protein
MRFEQLLVENFKGIRKAEVPFGPGLNILYGPNDIGKSTLATALRAVLLVPSSSSEAEGYLPWGRDEAPRVRLIFRDDDDHLWRVTKSFGDARSSAELDSAKNGRDYTNEARGREVDDKIRRLLKWGVPSPGGKGAPRGLPESFLSRVLLAEQTDVDAVLQASIANDGHEDGKIRLVSALAAFAQNKLLKQVLDRAVEERDRYFTAKGLRKRGKTSPFTDVAERLQRATKALADVQEQLEESRNTEALVLRLKEQREALQLAQQDAGVKLEAARAGLAAARARTQAARLVDEARNSVASIDAEAQRVAEAERKVHLLEEAAKVASAAVETASGDEQKAKERVAAAEEALVRAKSDDAVRGRELQAQRIDADLARLAAREAEIGARKERASRVAAAGYALQTARGEQKKISTFLEQARQRAVDARQRVAAAIQELALARARLAYGRWRAATEAATAAAQASAEAAALRSQADALDRDASEMLAILPADLPSAEALTALRDLERALERAEGALGGGISIRLAPRKPVAVLASIDGDQRDLGVLTTELTLDAHAVARLAIGDLLDVDVQAGSPEARNEAFRLRKAWESEGLPALTRFDAKSVNELERNSAQANDTRSRAAELSSKAAVLRAQTVAHEQRVTELQRQAARAPERWEALEGAHVSEQQLLNWFQGRKSKSWEGELEQLEKRHQQSAEAAAEAAHKAELDFGGTSVHAEEAGKRVDSCGRELEALAADTDVIDAARVLQQAEEELAQIAKQRSELDRQRKTLSASANGEVETAEKGLTAATGIGQAASQRLEELRGKHRSALQSLHLSTGSLAAQKERLAKLDRAQAEAAQRRREAELAALPDPGLTEADVAAAESEFAKTNEALTTATRQFDEAQGALQRVGGASLRDQAKDMQQAVDVELLAERQLEIEAQSWQLLHDTVREVENEEGTHLGRALAGPVAQRFGELTSKRYGELQLAPGLEAQGLTGPGNPPPEEVLQALSVGTKDQLATLIRLTIAETLQAAIVLDDHLVHTDPARLAWFGTALRQAAARTQVLVLTCRPRDYVAEDELPLEVVTRDLAGASIRVTNIERLLARPA